jgi:hypothetical protein
MEQDLDGDEYSDGCKYHALLEDAVAEDHQEKDGDGLPLDVVVAHVSVLLQVVVYYYTQLLGRVVYSDERYHRYHHGVLNNLSIRISSELALLAIKQLIKVLITRIGAHIPQLISLDLSHFKI